MRYDRGRQVYSGKIVNGKWHFDQGVFDSPSGAASGLAVTKKDEKTKLNGYNYLEFRLPGSEKWVFLRDLRDARGRKEIDLSKVVLMKAKQPIGK